MTLLICLCLLAAEPAAPPAICWPEVCLTDLDRFGLTSICQTRDVLDLIARMRDVAQTRSLYFPHQSWYWDALAEDQQQRWHTWDALDWAIMLRDQPREEDRALDWLEVLRQKIGPEAYYEGRMPLPVSHLFPRID